LDDGGRVDGLWAAGVFLAGGAGRVDVVRTFRLVVVLAGVFGGGSIAGGESCGVSSPVARNG